MKPDWNSNVQPKRRVRQAHEPWFCRCDIPEGSALVPKLNPGFLAACSDCKEKRPC